MKKSIFLFFAAILCATSAWGYNLPANYYIYFEKPTSWTQACLLIGKGDYSEGRQMTKISNTNLYYWTTVKWDGYTEYFFMQDKWGGESSSPTHRNQYAGSNKTAVFKTEFKKYHLFTTAGSKSSHASDRKIAINRTQTIKVQLKDGSNWVDATVVPADLTASTYAMTTSSTAVSAASASLAKESTTVFATVDAAYSAKVTLSCTNILDGYVFEGWYDVNGNKITSYTVSDAHTVYARFIQSAEETNEVTVSYKCGATDVAAAITEQVGVETEKTFTAPTVTGYNFTGWTVGGGMTLTAGTASDAQITVVTKSASSDYTLLANYDEVIETIYFINTGKWNVVNLHRWNGTATATAWPGEAMTSTGEKIGEYDVYSFTAQQGAFANVIFTNKNTGSDQTDDLTWTAGKYYIYNYGGKTGWYTKAEAEELLVVPVVTHDITVKAVVPEVWNKGTISIHYWGDGITATEKPVATEKDGNWYKYTIANVPEGCAINVIFINGTNWSDNANQTANITGITESKCFQISSIKKDAEGKCTFTEVDCAADIKPEGDVYTVVGSSNELGLAWDPTKKANDMEKQDDGSYKKVYSNVELTTSVEWKIAKNGDWWNETPLENKAANGNSVLTITKSGIYNVTFTLSKDLKTAHAEAELLEETNTVADCFVSGNAALTGGAGWAGNEFKMEYDDATETYSYTLTGLATDKAYELKIVLGGAWYGFDELVVPAPANVSKGTDNSIAFKMEEAGDVTVTYHVTNGINLTGNFAAPAPEAKKYYVKGTHNEWTADATSEMTLDEEVYKKEVTLAKDVEFKINDGADAWWGKDNLGGKSYNELEGLESGNLKMKEAKTFTIIFKPAEHLITFEGLTEKAPAVITYQLKGVGGWSEAGIEMTENPDKAGEYKLTCQAISATDAVKVVKLADGVITDYYGKGTVKDGVEVAVNYDGDGNITLPEGTYDFYFDTNEAEKKLWIAVATGCTPATPTPDYTRATTAGNFGTICLPFGGTVEGAELFECVGQETGKVFIGSVTTLEAGVPYIFLATGTELAVYSDGTTAATPGTHNGLHGTFTNDTEVAVGNYILKDNALCQAEATCWVNANRAYLVMSEVPEGAPTKMPGRRYIGMDVEGENEATGFENITAPADKAVKAIINGQLIIIRDGEMYNAQGQLIK